MIFKKICFSVIVVLMVITVCFASNVAGRWSGTIEGQFEIDVDLKEEGKGNVAGLISSQIGEIPIIGGKLTGNDIEFNDLTFNGIAVSYIKGKIIGDTLHVNVGFQGQNFTGKLTRIK
ncbi:MAG TPA: hypothetical protein VNI52_09610 [Sphingobacteriaceae bacterium]|nr:hypothetical protein [Sphingobacteriaceae bacterium]